MAIVTPDQGQIELANCMLVNESYPTYKYLVDLFKNNYTPDQNSAASSFAIADYDGYEQQSFTRDQWSTIVNSAHQALALCSINPFQFSNNGAVQTIYGYLVRSATSGLVLWCERYQMPFVIGAGNCLDQPIGLLLFGSTP